MPRVRGASTRRDDAATQEALSLPSRCSGSSRTITIHARAPLIDSHPVLDSHRTNPTGRAPSRNHLDDVACRARELPDDVSRGVLEPSGCPTVGGYARRVHSTRSQTRIRSPDLFILGITVRLCSENSFRFSDRATSRGEVRCTKCGRRLRSAIASVPAPWRTVYEAKSWVELIRSDCFGPTWADRWAGISTPTEGVAGKPPPFHRYPPAPSILFREKRNRCRHHQRGETPGGDVGVRKIAG